MPHYTCVTFNRGHTHITQHISDCPEDALRIHISELPFMEGINPIGEELYWLQSIALGKHALSLQPVKNCGHTWQWVNTENDPSGYVLLIIETNRNE